MTAAFTRASIVPFDEAGKTAQDDSAIAFDFNPETLTLKITAGRAKDKARKQRQQVQHAGTSEATLSFDAVFDSTRPRDAADGRAPVADEKLDVRLRTMALAALISAPENPQGGGGGGNKQPAPRRVQFRWGSVIFNGLITQYQEVFDYFSPSGVPLRSKVQITISQQEFRYEVDSKDRAAARAAAPPAPAGLRDAAAAQGADSLFDLGSGGLSLGLSADFSADLSLGLSAGFSADFSASFSAGISLQANLGLSADVGLSVGAGISLSADAAVDVFGSAALGAAGGSSGAAATAGRAGLSGGSASAAAASASPWAPDGPAPGTRAASLAAIVIGQRAGGTALAAPNTPIAVTALAPRGSPPPVLPRAPSGVVPPALRSAPRSRGWDGERRPRWEAVAVSAAAVAAAARATATGGCGCARCRGGH